MQYLQQFTTFPFCNQSQTFYYLGLLSVHQDSKWRPYAWVDNVRKRGKLSVTLTPYNEVIRPESVKRMLEGITSKKDADLHDLKAFLTLKAQYKESERGAKENIRSLVQAYRPCITAPHILDNLAIGQPPTDDPLLPPSVDTLPTPVVAGTWSWEKWTSPPDLYLLLEQWMTTKYPKSLHLISEIPEPSIDRRRLASARTTLTYLLEQIRAWDAQQTHYIEHPHPLLSYTTEGFARLPQEEQTQLMADCQTWFSVNMLIDIGTYEGEVTEGWDNEDEKHYMYATRYAVDDGKVVDTEQLIAASADDLADYLQSLNS